MSSEFYKEELVARLEAISERLAKCTIAFVEQSITTCVVCDHWNQTGETCMKFNGQRPPARVIAFGCPAFENEIPF